MSRSAGRTGACLWFLLVASCQFGPLRSPNAVDPAVYAHCDDPVGEAAWRRAQAALARGDDAAALPDLLVCATRCPDLVRAHLAYQDAAKRLGGNVAQTMVAFYVDAPERPSPVPAYLRARLADTAYAQSNALEAILDRDDSFAWAHLSKGRVLRGQGRLAEAVASYELALVNDRELFEARLERAQVLNDLGRYEESAADYARYLRERPVLDAAAVEGYLGVLIYRIGRLDEALEWIDKLAAAGHESPELRMHRAAVDWRGGRPREAVEGYVGALRSDPQLARAALNIGLLYYEVVPSDDAERRRYWPKARAAFRLFLAGPDPTDGFEQFERSLAVPYRLHRIEALIGRAPDEPPSVDDLVWPAGAGRG
jgi:tetratricopeptide (TPR) repeat protein